MAETRKLEAVISLKDQLSGNLKKIEGNLGELQKKVSKSNNNLQGLQDKLGNLVVIGAKVAAVLITVGAATAVAFAKSAIDSAAEYERTMISLEIIAKRFNISIEGTKKAANKLGKELRIGPKAAAEGLQNLLKSGLNLKQSTDLMKRFANEALTGKSSTISLGQAVENLAFAYTTENSALGNLSGISENYSDIIERGARLMGKNVGELNTAERAQAKYRGMMELTNITLGSAEKLRGTYTDNLAVLGQNLDSIKLKFGQAILPIATKLSTILIPALDELAKMINENDDEIKVFVDNVVKGIDSMIKKYESLKKEYDKFINSKEYKTFKAEMDKLWKETFKNVENSIKNIASAFDGTDLKMKDTTSTILGLVKGISFLINIFSKIANALSRILGPALQITIGWWQTLLGLINGVIRSAQNVAAIWKTLDFKGKMDALGMVSNPGAMVGAVGAKILGGKLGKNATGSLYSQGGMTLVGERGPELVNLPRGSKVNTASQTAGMGGQTINLNINLSGAVVTNQQQFIDMLTRQVTNTLSNQNRLNQFGII